MSGGLTDDAAWVAYYDQKRAAVDEYLDQLVETAQEDPRGPTDTFLALVGYVSIHDHDSLAVLTVAAIARLAAQRGPPC